MTTLYDMHCHLDFAEDSKKIAQGSAEVGICALSCTVIPSSYVSDQEMFQDCSNITLSLGMHPWWVADNRVSEVNIARFEQLLPDTRFIGEIGLDLASTRKETKTHQLEVLQRILDDVHQEGDGRVITFHAVHAATLLMDLLDQMGTLKHNTALFHWFQGSHEEFGRAVATGALMSVGMRMMATEKGALYAAGIPDEQLLLETDNPPHEGSEWNVATWRQELENTATSLAQLRGCSPDHIIEVTTKNSEMILS